MDMPENLRKALVTLTEEVSSSRLMEEARRISFRYRDRGEPQQFIQSRSEALAYAVARMPATYGAVSSALAYTLTALEGWGEEMGSLLDVGAGTGAATWAADGLVALQKVVCVERETMMRQIGTTIMAFGSEALQNAMWIECDIASQPIPSRGDLVIASYVLNELNVQSQAEVSEKLWDCAEKLLLIVEPGTPEGYRTIERVRTILLQRGAHIVAPCPHENPCPMLEQDWCHFSCRIPRSQLHRLSKGGEAPYEDEKYAYVALARERGPLNEGGRILRHPQIAKGIVRIQLCTEEGITWKTLSKRDGEAYKRVRKAKCGDWVE